MIVSVTYYLELRNAITVYFDVIIHQVKLLILHNVQTFSLTFYWQHMNYSINIYSISSLQIVSNTKYHI